MSTEKHKVRFYFWKNRYDLANHGGVPSIEGDVLSWEDREFESFEAAMSFTRMIDCHSSKIFNSDGNVIYNSQDPGAHWLYA
jgi:hypothetical protein